MDTLLVCVSVRLASGAPRHDIIWKAMAHEKSAHDSMKKPWLMPCNNVVICVGYFVVIGCGYIVNCGNVIRCGYIAKWLSIMIMVVIVIIISFVCFYIEFYND